MVSAVVELNRLACENLPREEERRHVRAPPRTVDGEEAQPRRRQAVKVGVGVGHRLVGLLGGCVEGQGMVRRVAGGERQPGVGAVDGAGGGVDQVLDAVAPTSLQDMGKPDQVGVHVGHRVLQRVGHPGLGGQVDHSVEAAGVEVFGDGWGVAQVDLPEREPVVLPEPGDPVPLELGIVVRVEVVDAGDLVSRVQQSARDEVADEPGGPGDQHVHEGVGAEGARVGWVPGRGALVRGVSVESPQLPTPPACPGTARGLKCRRPPPSSGWLPRPAAA